MQPNVFEMTRYLMNFGAPVRNNGFYDNIIIVPAGSVITIDRDLTTHFNKFADVLDMVSPDKTEELNRLNKEQIVDLVDEQMQHSVQQMLLADVPVGALCSGGVDSSLLMAIAAKNHNNLAIFHADVVGPLSEYDAAADLAKHLKLDLLTVQTHDDDFVGLTPEVMYHYEQPFSGHPHSVPFMMVSKLVQKHGVKAVLTGEGSDECFLGYEYIAMEPFWIFYHSQTKKVRDFIETLPVIGHQIWDNKNEFPRLIPEMLGQFEHVIDHQNVRDRYSKALNKPVDLNVRTLDLLRDHLVTLLHRNDTMGMSASIETRFPFLNEQLIETAVNMPLRYKIRFSPDVWEKDHPFLRDKWVIRKVADRYLPKRLSQRKKRGFYVNAFRRMKIDKQFFNSGFVKEQFKLSDNALNYMIDSAQQQQINKLMMLEVWGRLFIHDIPLSGVQQQLRSSAIVKRM